MKFWFKGKESEDEPKIMKYKFKWKTNNEFLWKSQMCIAHKYVEEKNRMVLYRVDGGIFEIPDWSTKWSCLMGDWAEKMKVTQEQESKTEEPDSGEKLN
jgi:hypothetical protein